MYRCCAQCRTPAQRWQRPHGCCAPEAACCSLSMCWRRQSTGACSCSRCAAPSILCIYSDVTMASGAAHSEACCRHRGFCSRCSGWQRTIATCAGRRGPCYVPVAFSNRCASHRQSQCDVLKIKADVPAHTASEIKGLQSCWQSFLQVDTELAFEVPGQGLIAPHIAGIATV